MKIDPNQFEQVILNLAGNARDAMPGGGILTIETRNSSDYLTRSSSGAGAQQCVCIRVTDTGRGMDAETIAHLFEPFFTTKRFGEGTGLGLAIAFGIIGQSGGRIFVDSEVGRGSTFEILLPPSDQQEVLVKPSAISQTASRVCCETILVVEDEAIVREMICVVLKLNGDEVIEASTGGEALTICQSRSDIDLIITDLVMPEMGGLELMSRLQNSALKCKALYMSGYIDELQSESEVLNQSHFIKKPFNLEDFSAKVREVLDSVE